MNTCEFCAAKANDPHKPDCPNSDARDAAFHKILRGYKERIEFLERMEKLRHENTMREGRQRQSLERQIKSLTWAVENGVDDDNSVVKVSPLAHGEVKYQIEAHPNLYIYSHRWDHIGDGEGVFDPAVIPLAMALLRACYKDHLVKQSASQKERERIRAERLENHPTEQEKSS